MKIKSKNYKNDFKLTALKSGALRRQLSPELVTTNRIRMAHREPEHTAVRQNAVCGS